MQVSAENIDDENKSPIASYFEKRLATFSFYFDEIQFNFGIDEVHKFRVEIKKHRAFLRFLEFHSNTQFSNAKHEKSIATIFKPGGRLRETQVNQSLVLRYRSYSLEGYKSFLAKKNEKQKKKLNKAIQQFDVEAFQQLNKFVNELLTIADGEKVRIKAYHFINSELEAIRKLRPLISGNKELHQVRTHTKALGYITKFINQLYPDQNLAELLQKAKPTEKLIGNWHDRVVLRNSLNRYSHKNLSAFDLDEVKKLRRQIKTRNKTSVNIIAERLDTFIGVVL